MAHQRASPEVHPHARIVLAGRVRNQIDRITRVQRFEVSVASGEYRPMHSGSELHRASRGKGRWLHQHGGPFASGFFGLIFGTSEHRERPIVPKQSAASHPKEDTMDPIYLDHASTTPVRPEVRAAMEPYLAEIFGNASSVHRWGRKAATGLEDARTRVAAALGGDRNDFYFVRGGTESDNLAVFGRAQIARSEGRTPLIVASAIEHTAILTAAEIASGSDGQCVLLDVRPSGDVDEEELDRLLERKPDLVSFMMVNNETGLQLPVERIARKARAAGVCVHTDAVQAVGKIRVNLDEVAVDLASFTGHKIYGPKSTGLLYKRSGTELEPRVVGGGQERAVRSGTEDVAGAVGMSVAIELAVAEQEGEAERLGRLKVLLLSVLTEGVEDFRIHGDPEVCAPHVLNIGIPGVDRQTLLIELDLAGVAVSSGPACSSGSSRGSHVLAALYGTEIEGPSLRFSFGKLNDEVSVREAGRRIVEAVARTRSNTVV